MDTGNAWQLLDACQSWYNNDENHPLHLALSRKENVLHIGGFLRLKFTYEMEAKPNSIPPKKCNFFYVYLLFISPDSYLLPLHALSIAQRFLLSGRVFSLFFSY